MRSVNRESLKAPRRALPFEAAGQVLCPHRGFQMSPRKVILYFDDHRDALRFTLAAGSVMSGADHPSAGQNVLRIIQPLARATRIRVGKTATNDDEGGTAA